MVKRRLLGLIVMIVMAVSFNAADLMALSFFSTERVSIASDESEGNKRSYAPAISADGRFIVFKSDATNLVDGDINNTWDILLRDRQTGETIRISPMSDLIVNPGESASPAISANGDFVAFDYGVKDVFVYIRETEQLSLVSVDSNEIEANAESYGPAISADGRFVAFISSATNLVNDDTNNRSDIFVRDRQTGETTRVSVASDGTEADYGALFPSISSDGRYVTFSSVAQNLVSGDTNNFDDIFVHDRETGQTTRVSVASDGTQANDNSFFSRISGNGRFVVFESRASNLVVDDTNVCGVYTISGQCPDIFVHDRQTGKTTRLSVASNGAQANYESFNSAISEDGRFVAFASSASNLVSGDTNICEATLTPGRCADIFVHDRDTGETTRINLASNGAQANGLSGNPAISANGEYIAFASGASNLVSGDTNAVFDVFMTTLLIDLPTAFPRRNLFTTDTPTLTWNRLSWALHYDIQIATTTNFSTSLVYEGSTTATDLEHLVTQSLDDGLYYWHVRGGGASGVGDWSRPDEFVVDAD